MPKIFLCYRRDDTAGYAGRVAERLSQSFGDEYVFRDLDDIHPGANFAETIRQNIASCDALIALIGPHWLSIADSSGVRRLDDPQDFVRIEIAAALEKEIRVIPVLVQRAEMPTTDMLPEVLKPLAMRQALELSDSRWEYDMKQLIVALDEFLPRSTSIGKHWIVPTLLGVVASVVGWLIFQTSPLRSSNHSVDARDADQSRHARSAGVLGTKNVINVRGPWVGSWTGPQGKAFQIRFNFETQGAVLMGSVRYPTGEGGIYDGKVDGDQLVFVTRHTPQFEDKEVVISFVGKVAGDSIEFIMQRPHGAQRLIARRAFSSEVKP